MPTDLADALLEQIRTSTRIQFPSTRYQKDPVAFCREILGMEPWSKQREILEAIRDHKRVAVSSGHKIGKSSAAVIAALWFYCSFEDARVVMTSTTGRQVNAILWRELRMVRARSGRCLACKKKDPYGKTIPRPCPHSALIDGQLGKLANTGLKSEDFREIQGFTAREPEAVAGISGKNLLYLPDEASGIPEAIYEAIEGNRAGDAWIAMFSNPTKTIGTFFDAFHSKSDFYRCIQVSSEETPNVIAGKKLVPGLATREWVDEKRQEWGEESPLYKVRVRGEFALGEDGKIFNIEAITNAEERWASTSPAGGLFIGLDPAGATGSGDESCFVVRRGQKVIAIIAERGNTADAHRAKLLGLIKEHAIRRETPVIVLDREGSIGAELYGNLRDHEDRHPNDFQLIGVRASDRATRQPAVYDRQRDALTASLEQWMREGGAIPEDTKLAAELHTMEWIEQANGRLKVTPKKEIRKLLGRSPDRYDALALSTWEPLSLRMGRASEETDTQPQSDTPTPDPYPYDEDVGADPYGEW
jgi:hypothetical protein